jgi:hypothetical protein
MGGQLFVSLAITFSFEIYFPTSLTLPSPNMGGYDFLVIVHSNGLLQKS